MTKVLEFDHVSYYYKDGRDQNMILNDCSYSFETGKIYAIVGSSGSGKTTTVVLAGGLDSPKKGHVIYKDQDIKRNGLTAYRQKDVSIVFQSYNLIYYMNALENVINAMDIAHLKKDNKKEYAMNILKRFGLTESECKRDIRQLSGGQQQRVAIARAMAKDVDLILADEPTGNLDIQNSLDIMNCFIEMAHQNQKCIIIVTHSLELANMCDIQLQIKEGKLIQA